MHWLAQAKQVAFPTSEGHLLHDLQLRVLEHEKRTEVFLFSTKCLGI